MSLATPSGVILLYQDTFRPQIISKAKLYERKTGIFLAMFVYDLSVLELRFGLFWAIILKYDPK